MIPARARIGLLSLGLLGPAGCGGSEPEDPPPGPAWTRAFDADGLGLGWGLSVWGPSESRRFVVGGRPGADAQAPGEGRAFVYDGAEWSRMSLPDGTPSLNWVFGFGPDQVWMVGNDGTVLRYDGQGFTIEPTPTDQELWGVWGTGPDTMWAVGGRGRAEGEATLLTRTGTEWVEVELPELERPGVNALFKVWGSAADDVYVVGQRGAVLHHDGAEWTELGVGTSQDLISVWGTGSDDVTVVGGRGNGVAAHWDGAAWTLFALAPAPGLNGVWTDAPGAVWVAGEVGLVARLDTTTGELAYEDIPLSAEARQADFHAVFGVGGRILAVGGNFSIGSMGPFRGLAWSRPRP